MAILYPTGSWNFQICSGTLQEDIVRTLTGKSIVKLVKQFPFLGSVVDLESVITQPEHFILKAHVSVANSECLYQIPNFCLEPHWIGSLDDKYIGHKEPSAFAIGADNQIVNSTVWNYDQKGHFLKRVIDYRDDVKCVVLVVKYIWWHNISDWLDKKLDIPVGEFSHHEYLVFIYKSPEQGFLKLLLDSQLYSNVRINDLLSIGMAAIDEWLEPAQTIRELEALVDKFEKSVGQKLWRIVNECKTHGMSSTFGKTDLLVYAIAGRIMLTFRSRTDDDFTVVGDESDYTRTGLQSMHCTVDSAKRMVNEVIDNWELGLFKPDDNVMMA